MAGGNKPGSPTRTGGSFTRMLSRASHAMLHPHDHALEEIKARIAERKLAIPSAMVYNGDFDAMCMRFLRARKFNLDAAMLMLEKSLTWRARVGADAALGTPMPEELVRLIRECRPSSYIGFDLQGHPIFVERLGKLDGARIEAEHITDEQVLTYHLREMEFMGEVFAKASQSAGRTVDQVVSIMDAAGLTLTALTGYTTKLFRLITGMDSDNYPETCHAIYIVNGGMAFSAIWRIVAPFVDKGTRDKVHVLSGAKHTQQALARACGSISRVPSFLGGELDYEATRREWLEEMDAVMSARTAAPVAVAVAAAQDGAAVTTSGSHFGPKHHAEEVAAPKSAVSRSSFAAGSVYFDAYDGGTQWHEGMNPGSSPSASRGCALTAAASEEGATPRAGEGDAVAPPSPVATGAATMGSVVGSVGGAGLSHQGSVCSNGKPQASLGANIAAGAGRVPLGSVEEPGDGQQPACGCRCTVS